VTGREWPGQLIRLDRFRAQHPGAVIKRDDGFGYWQAWMPAGNGGTVITRYGLKDLLDKLDELLGPEPGHGGADAGPPACGTAPGADHRERRR
jgi:hypothetical protein